MLWSRWSSSGEEKRAVELALPVISGEELGRGECGSSKELVEAVA